MMRNKLFTDNDIIREAQDKLREWLPNTWAINQQRGFKSNNMTYDALIDISAPDGGWAQLIIEARKNLDPKDVETAVSQLWRLWNQTAAGQTAVLVIEAPYLSERTREKLRNLGAGYIDMTGNAYLRLDRPALLIERSGASKNPWRTERPARSLKGRKAARLVRSLIDFRPPRGIRELAQIADIDPGYASRLLTFLEREDLITRKPRGPVEQVDWPELIRTWARDYSLTKSNVVYSYLQPRGISAFLDGLRSLSGDMRSERYAITGSLAAARRAPMAPARLGICYTENVSGLADKLELLPAETGANVLLVSPFDEVVFERTTTEEKLTYVAPSQAAADLLSGSGRMPEEGEALINWMQTHEGEWRAQ